MSNVTLNAWQKANTVQVKLRLSRNKDSEAISFLQSTGSPTQTIRRLIREEITRTGWTPPDEVPCPASLSLEDEEN